MAVISSEEKNTMSRTEDVVCSYFGISLMKVVSRDLTNETVMARNCLFYLLHNDYGISISKIASSYYRQERSVKAQLAKMRVCMKNNKAYRSVHESLLDLMKKSGL